MLETCTNNVNWAFLENILIFVDCEERYMVKCNKVTKNFRYIMIFMPTLQNCICCCGSLRW